MPRPSPHPNLHVALIASVTTAPDKTAVFWGDEQITYDQLLTRARSLAGALRHQGIDTGDRVALWLKNSPEFIAAYYGILLAGGVVVPVNNFLKPAEVEHIVRDAGAKVVIAEPDLITADGELRRRLRETRLLSLPELAGQGPLEAPADRQPGDLAVIIYTSGTTGRSKGAMLTHGNLLHNIGSCAVVLEAVGTDRFAVMLPLFHSFMMTVGMILPLTLGGSLVLIRSLNPPKNAILEIMRHQATILPAVPQFFRALAAAGIKEGLPLRVCISGGGPLPAEIHREFEEKMPLPLIEGYGLSEASPVVSLNPIHGKRKAGSIGLPIDGVEMAVWDDAGQELGAGQTGEIVVRGGNVMAGYWNQPESTAAALRDGWLLTGDIGHRDEEGYYYITDRKKDMLVVNGINVYPREIEEVIYQFPGIREAAVIGRADARRGEQAIAFFAVNDGAVVDTKELGAFVKSRLADYKVPRKFLELPALPRNATGKVLKTALREIPIED